MVEPLYPLFPIASFLGFVLVLIPLPWHLQAWNSGTCFYVFWTSLACLNQFINSVTWANDAINKAPVWCDICKPGLSAFIQPSDRRVVCSYPDNAGRYRRDPCVIPVYYAEAAQHREGSSRLTNA